MKFPAYFGRKSKKSSAARKPSRCRLSFDTLEDRLTPSGGGLLGPGSAESLVAGTVYRDSNASNRFDPNELGLAGRVVFADGNHNGQLDQGEISTTASPSGGYSLPLPPGEYSIRAILGPNETSTSPTGGSIHVTVEAGFVELARDFGSLFINPAAPMPRPTEPFPTVQNANEGFVQDVYRDTLGRNAEPAGLAFWVSQLPQGQPIPNPMSKLEVDTNNFHAAARQTVAAGIWNSTEHRALQVDSYYRTLLDRDFDTAGKVYWIRLLQAGASESAVMEGFVVSPEYQASHASDVAYVTALYEDLLGRAPDAGGLGQWMTALQQGASRAQIVEGFLFSIESVTRLVDSYYTAILNRPADPQGLDYWRVGVQQRFLTVSQAGTAFLSSLENYQSLLNGQGGGGVVSEIEDSRALLMPGNTVTEAEFKSGKVMVYDESAQLKKITLTNNSDRTVYPILQGTNSRTAGTTDPWYGTPSFSPFDTLNNEYRGYVGYQMDQGGRMIDVLGLPKHSTITVNVPLVFWDGGRVNIATDASFLTPRNPIKTDSPAIPNPFHYHKYNVAQQNLGSTTGGSTELTFTGLQGKAGSIPETLLNDPNPTKILVTGDGIPELTFISSFNRTNNSVVLSKPAFWKDPNNHDLQKNTAYNFTWPLPETISDTPPGPPHVPVRRRRRQGWQECNRPHHVVSRPYSGNSRQRRTGSTPGADVPRREIPEQSTDGEAQERAGARADDPGRRTRGPRQL